MANRVNCDQSRVASYYDVIDTTLQWIIQIVKLNLMVTMTNCKII